jgi:hypothetical protein
VWAVRYVDLYPGIDLELTGEDAVHRAWRCATPRT